MFNVYGKLYVGGPDKQRTHREYSTPESSNQSVGRRPVYNTPAADYKVITVGDRQDIQLEDKLEYSEHGYWPGIISDHLNADRRTLLLVSDESYIDIQIEALDSAKALVGYSGVENTLLVGCDPNKLPLELVVQFINDGIDPTLFKDKARKMLRNSLVYRANSDLGQLKAMMFHRPEIIVYLAEALYLPLGSLALPQSFVKYPLLLKACRGWVSYDDFVDEAQFVNFLRVVSRIKLDPNTSGFYESDNSRTTEVVEERLAMLDDDDIAAKVFNNLHIFKGYLLSKGDRYDLEALTKSTKAIFSHPQWWKSDKESDDVLTAN